MNFTQFLLILNARKWVVAGVLAAVVGVTAAVSLVLPREYTATTTLIVDSKSKDPLSGQILPSQMFPGYMATQIEIIKSSQVANRVVHSLKLADTPGVREQFLEATQGQGTVEAWLGERLLRNIGAEPSRESSVISISFTGSDPRFAAIVANAFARAYIETNLDLRVAPARDTAAWFDQQIALLRDKLDQAQQKLTAYQRAKGLVESDERLDVETGRMAALSAQMVAAQSAAFEATSRTRDSVNMPEVINNPVVQNLKAQVAQGEGRLAELGRRLGENHPDYQRVLAEVNAYRAKLAAELSTATRGVGASAGAARQRHGELVAAFERQKGRVLALKEEREEASRLAREVDNAQRIYDSALQRYGQSRMESQSTQTDIVVLNPATPPQHASSPRVTFNLLLATFLGTLLGVGFGLALELFDRRVRSGTDIAVSLGMPVLAEVPRKGRMFNALRRLFGRTPIAVS